MKQLIIMLFIALNCPTEAQKVFPKDNLDKVVSTLIQNYQIPNAVIAITNKDSLIYTFSTPNTTVNDVFLIGSNSKSFTAIAIGQLVDKGLIDIDKPVSYYLHWFSFTNETADKKITIRHLLNQTSGIPGWGGFYTQNSSDFEAYQQGFSDYLKTLPAVHDVGTAFQYSNANYVLLGLIIEKVSGKTYGDYLNEHIFSPLKMIHSFANFKNALSNGLIKSYQYAFLLPIEAPNKEYSDFEVSSGHLASTANDLCPYLRAVMKNTEGVGLTDSSYQRLFAAYKGKYAMGWFEKYDFGQRVLWHTGLTENFNSALFFLPKQYGVVVLANTNSIAFNEEMKKAIVTILLNKPYSPRFSIERVQKAGIFLWCLSALGFFFFNFYKWQKQNFAIHTPKISNLVKCLVSISLSFVPVLLIPKIVNITLVAMIQYSPDFGYGFIVIAIFGTSSALIGLVRKKKLAA